uniref:Uncharacterized protein n=1 Tax=Anguilla anguilla TaxID=7936 RepID=A0A0E9SD26_ANGAN
MKEMCAYISNKFGTIMTIFFTMKLMRNYNSYLHEEPFIKCIILIFIFIILLKLFGEMVERNSTEK